MSDTGDIRLDEVMPHLNKAWTLIPFEESLADPDVSFKKLKKKQIFAKGLIPVIDQGEDTIAGYTNDIGSRYVGPLPLVIFGDHTRRFKFVDFEFAVGADGTKLLHPISALDARFFFHYMQSLNIVSQGYSRHYRFLREVQVPLPPLPEQKRIVVKLEQLLERVKRSRKKLDRIPNILKRFRQSVLAAACSGKLTEDWREEKQISREISWLEKDFFDFIVLQRGYDLVLSTVCPGNYPVVTSAGVEYYHSIMKVKAPGVVTGRSGSLGKVFYIEKDFWPHNTALFVKDFKGNLPRYVYFFLLGFNASEYSSSTAVPTLNRNNLRGVTVSVPPYDEQKEIVRRVEQLFTVADKIEQRYTKANKQVEKLTQSILAKAFRGELVPQDPNDEPASVLLQRILEEKKKNAQ